ncbi:TIGR01244 family sulfur transferase [Caulobacter sp. 17J80-11]|uniref:TIGR01244 family sulfur transferase n=1 Tax=Caulobacter sp. 17J80-11 TaxID=2763502 RepID=UPI0016538D80|nr:TIGR01244 family sulfur transferase [Caulobacter sp. 17J80-11]MBC6981184.1 TIGR01244 family phosphatase [Caulobacter sp. 17J80-11]
MTEFRKVTDGFWVSPQIRPDDVRAAAERGFALIVNHRPEGEEPGQPAGESIAEAARAAGLAYVAIPVRGRPTAEQAQATAEAVAAAQAPVLAYCRSGTRSIAAWSLGQALAGERTRDELLGLGAAAGYDLEPWL